MAKIPFSDVTPPSKRSIRNVPIPNGGKRKMPSTVSPERERPTETNLGENSREENDAYEYYYPKNNKVSEKYNDPSRKTRKRQWLFGSVIAVLIAVFVVGMMTVFASATIDIVPKSQDVDVNIKTIAANVAEENGVRYEVIKLSKSGSISLPATGEEAVEIKASGKIIIYNNFSSEPQRLIIRTRFESPEGLIYRISESVAVPGKTIKNGTEVPGSIEVEVFADEAGEKYNIKKTDFTVPGFKNDPARYKAFYARSVTDMSGGFIGKMKTVSQSEKEEALQNIDSETRLNLIRDLESKVPNGLTMLSDAVVFDSRELPPGENGSSVTIRKEVTAYALMLDKEDLSKQITDEYISKLPDWSQIKSTVNDFSLLRVTDMPSRLDGVDKLELQIAGKSKVLADIDTNAISQKLLGAPRKDAAKLIDEYPGISSITTTIRPVWKRSFPDNSAKIKVVIDIE